MDASRTVALALGGGGARGYAHVGVIDVLRERGFEIVGVSGTSMGSLIGGLHAADRLDEYVEWARGLKRADVLRMLDVSPTAPGAMRASKVLATVRSLVGDLMIEDLPLPFTAVATDLFARREVWLQRGRLDMAIRASIALPGIFTPVTLNGRLLADGGLMDPVPVAPTASIGADLTVAVSVGSERSGLLTGAAVGGEVQPTTGERVSRFREDAAEALEERLSPHIGTAPVIREGFARRKDERASATEESEEYPFGLTGFDVMSFSLSAMQTLVARYRLAGMQPDVLITVPMNDVALLDFHRADTMIEVGRAAAIEALDEWLERPGSAQPRGG